MKKKCTFKSILKIPTPGSIRGKEPLVTLSTIEHTTVFFVDDIVLFKKNDAFSK